MTQEELNTPDEIANVEIAIGALTTEFPKVLELLANAQEEIKTKDNTIYRLKREVSRLEGKIRYAKNYNSFY